MRKCNINKQIIILLCILTVSTILGLHFSSTTASASEAKSQYIYDEAGLLSSSEYDEVEEMCLKYKKEAGIGIYILTHNNAHAADGITYIANFYDKGNYGDSVFLLIDMHNREVVIEGYGSAETYIHSKRADIIRNEISPYLINADYVTAFETYIKDSAAYMKDDSDLNYDHNYNYDTPSGNEKVSEAESILTNIWFQLAVSLIIGGIAVGIMAYNSGGRMTAGGNTYLDGSHSGLIGRQDNYIRTTVTRVHKPTQNNNGRGGFNAGGFGGGVSSGGSSHSTSSGHF